jgi:hypothetical protein
LHLGFEVKGRFCKKRGGDFLSGYFSFWWMDYFESLVLLGGDEILQSFGAIRKSC